MSPAKTGDPPETCVACGKPTRSHPVPEGWLCHTCLVKRDETALLEELDVPTRPDLNADTDLACSTCGYVYTLREGYVPGSQTLILLVGASPFDALDAVLIGSCPRCTQASEWLTTTRAAEALATDLGIPLGRGRRGGRRV